MLKTGVYPKSKARLGKVYLDFIANLESNTGSVTSFLGVARSESADGSKKTRFLVMESYQRHANKVLQKICVETRKKFKLNDIRIVHALGKFRPGEPVVLVVVSSPRRDSSLLALREAVERYKKEPALFKQEIYEDGSSAWIT
ncbi:MAG: molybdenum cofactor biosynthesis protein MoaE [Nitrososphaerales archaeon]